MDDAYGHWSKRWLAAAHERVARTDEVLDAMDAVIRDRWRTLAARLVRAVRSAPPAERRAVIRTVLDRAIRHLLRALADALVAGRKIAAQTLAQSIPDALLPELLGRLVAGSNQTTLTESIGGLVLSFDLPTQSANPQQSALTPQEARAAIAAVILPPLDRQSLMRTWTHSPGKTNADPLAYRLSSRLWSPPAKAAIEASLTDGLSQGETVDQLTQRVRSAVSAQTWQARRIARTEARRALERDHLGRTITALGDMVLGIMIQAVMDDRTRPEHAARHGTIYYRQSDGQFRNLRRKTAPELPDAPNCRCTYVPVLREPDLSPPARQAYETATDRLIPDMPTYQEIWDRANVRTRRRMIGARRYDLALEKFGGVDPWMVLSPGGRLLSLGELEKSNIDEAYETRSIALTGRYLFVSSPGRDEVFPGASQSAFGAGIARRVLARADLPVNLEPQQAIEYIRRRVPALATRTQLSAEETVQAIRQACHAWAQTAAASPQVTHDVLRDAVWRLIRRDQPARPMTYTFVDQMPADVKGRLDQAIEWVRWLVPDRDLPVLRVKKSLVHRDFYEYQDDAIVIEPSANTHRILHELLHRVDWLYHGKQFKFGDAYVPFLGGGEVRRTATSSTGKPVEEVYDRLKSGAPGLYYYQRRRYGQKRGLEFITVVGEQLYLNPTLAAFGDPEGLKIWIEQMRKLSSGK